MKFSLLPHGFVFCFIKNTSNQRQTFVRLALCACFVCALFMPTFPNTPKQATEGMTENTASRSQTGDNR